MFSIPPIPGSMQQTQTLPPGTIVAFAGDVTPNATTTSSPPESSGTQDHPIWTIEYYGWMPCDGRSLKILDFPYLYSALGHLYGGDKEHFNIPNYQGQFLRGVGSDSDKASLENRKAQGKGTVMSVGSTQMDALQSHLHHYTKPNDPTVSGSKKGKAVAADSTDSTKKPITDPKAKKVSGQDIKLSNYESRPTNVFVHYIIKFI